MAPNKSFGRSLRFEPLESRALLSATTFTLTAPTSGAYDSGQAVMIQWTATGVAADAKVSLCYDRDATWNGNETWIEVDQVSAVNGAGSYAWGTSGVPVGTYYVAGYLFNGGNDFASSHLTRSIVIRSTAPAFALTSPALGTVAVGQNVPITWTAANVVTDGKISLCYDSDALWNGNEHWIEVDQVAAVNGAGSYNWDTTGLTPGYYYVAGYMYNGDNSFTLSHMLQPITVQNFNLTAPTSGSYAAGEAISIQWMAANVVVGGKISLCYDEDATWSSGNQHWIEIDQVTAANGSHSYTWDTTGVTPGTYYIAGYMFDGASTFVTSHLIQAFTITASAPPSFTLSAPASGSYVVGDTVNIAWAAANIVSGSTISLCYDEDSTWSGGNQHWIEINAVTAADGSHSYAWDTTGVVPGTYYIAGYLFNGGNTFTLSHLTSSFVVTAV